MERVEDKYLDVLQNIESRIIAVYQDDPTLTDLHIIDALQALARRYQWEAEGRGTPTARLLPKARLVYDQVESICEWRLGRVKLHQDADPRPITLEAVVQCLRRLEISARLWNKEGGRQGYINYARRFLIPGG